MPTRDHGRPKRMAILARAVVIAATERVHSHSTTFSNPQVRVMQVTHTRVGKRLEVRMAAALEMAHDQVVADQGRLREPYDIILHLMAMRTLATYRGTLARTKLDVSAMARLSALLDQIISQLIKMGVALQSDFGSAQLNWAASHTMSGDPIRRRLADMILTMLQRLRE